MIIQKSVINKCEPKNITSAFKDQDSQLVAYFKKSC